MYIPLFDNLPSKTNNLTKSKNKINWLIILKKIIKSYLIKITNIYF